MFLTWRTGRRGSIRARGNIWSRRRPSRCSISCVDIEVLDLDRIEAGAVAEDRDAVADLEDLAEPVGDVDDRPALAGELADDRLDLLDLDVGERRGRLVEDEDAGVARQEPRDLDQLALGDRKVARRHRRVDVLEPDHARDAA